MDVKSGKSRMTFISFLMLNSFCYGSHVKYLHPGVDFTSGSLGFHPGWKKIATLGQSANAKFFHIPCFFSSLLADPAGKFNTPSPNRIAFAPEQEIHSPIDSFAASQINFMQVLFTVQCHVPCFSEQLKFETEKQLIAYHVFLRCL